MLLNPCITCISVCQLFKKHVRKFNKVLHNTKWFPYVATSVHHNPLKHLIKTDIFNRGDPGNLYFWQNSWWFWYSATKLGEYKENLQTQHTLFFSLKTFLKLGADLFKHGIIAMTKMFNVCYLDNATLSKLFKCLS